MNILGSLSEMKEQRVEIGISMTNVFVLCSNLKTITHLLTQKCNNLHLLNIASLCTRRYIILGTVLYITRAH
jgi:hypothetical protein